MIAVMLLMLAGGIGLALGVSDPREVSLRWLRLGGLIAVSLLAVALVIMRIEGGEPSRIVWFGVMATAVAFVVQLTTVQLGWRNTQQAAAVVAFMITTIVLMFALGDTLVDAQAALGAEWADADVAPLDGTMPIQAYVTFPTGASASALLGGFLMAMLLGHAYLTAGNEMTQAPFRRLVLVLAAVLAARAVFSLVFGLWPYLQAEDVPRAARMWNVVIITGRYAAGLAVPAVFLWMTYDCVQRRANQSVTGILYVAGVLIIMGEGMALALMGTTGRAF